MSDPQNFVNKYLMRYHEIINEAASPKRLLLIVHPGSACGSADFNLGDNDAQIARTALVQECDAWSGAVLVLDGELSTELKTRRYRPYSAAVDRCLARALQAGYPAGRVYACAMETPNWEAKAVAAIKNMIGVDKEIAITGAWHHLSDRNGCCDTMHDALATAGVKSTLLSSVLTLDSGFDDRNYEDDL